MNATVLIILGIILIAVGVISVLTAAGIFYIQYK